MSINTHDNFPVLTRHAQQRMTERGLTECDLAEAIADPATSRQATGRWEVRGRNGVTLILDPTSGVVVTVLPRGARPALSDRPGIGGNRHRRRPGRRRDQRTSTGKGRLA